MRETTLDLVPILKVATDPGQRDALGDAVRAQHVRRTDARQHQQLRGIERAAAQNDLPDA